MNGECVMSGERVMNGECVMSGERGGHDGHGHGTRGRHGARGVVLIICYIVIAVLTVLGAAFLTRSFSETRVAGSFFNSTQALWLAEAGIERALWELNFNGCGGCSVASPCPSGSRCVSGGLAGGSYEAVINDTDDTVTSTGAYPAVEPVTRKITAGLIFPSVFQYGIFSKNKVYFRNSASIDSYDSTRGEYGATLGDGSTNAYENGDVGTNSTTEGAIELDNSSKIYGDAVVGGDPETGIDAAEGAITGTRAGGINLNVPSVPVPPAPAGGWTAFPGTSTLGSGSYIAENIVLDNKYPSLTITGDATIYATGDISLGNYAALNIADGAKLTIYVDGTFAVAQTGTVNNIGKIPSSFTLYSRYAGTDGVTFNNNTALYGMVYAPDTKVSLAQSFQLYGAMVGQSTNLLNSVQVHYDESLATVATPFSTMSYSIRDWREQRSGSTESPF